MDSAAADMIISTLAQIAEVIEAGVDKVQFQLSQIEETLTAIHQDLDHIDDRLVAIHRNMPS